MTTERHDQTVQRGAPRVDPSGSSQATTRLVPPGAARPEGSDFGLTSGQTFGRFLIVRPLGKGGMGEVYEAEDRESGRRLALKLLSQRLTGPDDRARFLREGRLAASINHEHAIYIYGTEEIAGVPVITMELADGGSLKDRIDAEGPLATTAAVDLILQVIAGLEATASAGILHRDIKPSNCFVTRNGGVKVGDFGLSISTAARAESQLTVAGSMLGTPAFASPEQIRGQRLDVRSDIYSTGATLYCLLTATPPFTGASALQLVANVLEREPQFPTERRRELPTGLRRIVLRCLEKDPVRRYSNYEELRRQLQEFSSARLVAAPPGTRTMASFVDGMILALPMALFLTIDRGPWRTAQELYAGLQAQMALDLLPQLLYFGALEGRWGTALGKWLFGIRVVGANHRPPGVWRSLARVLLTWATVTLLPLALFVALPMETVEQSVVINLARVLCTLLGLFILFSTARRANGFAGLHDLMTRTRVVRRIDAPTRAALPMPETRIEVPIGAHHVGPYAVLGTLGVVNGNELLLGYDEMLRRPVWIRSLPVGAPALTPHRRDLARPGRLRLLNARRTSLESWDAYDAPDGQPFVTVVGEPQPWSMVRFLLYDLALELDAAGKEAGELRVDEERIWITRHGHAMLLDFPCPGLPARASTPPEAPQRWTVAAAFVFLRRVACAALTGHSHEQPLTVRLPDGSTQLPIHARRFLEQLEPGRFPHLEAMVSALQEILGKPAVLTSRTRVTHLLLSATLPIAAVALALGSAVLQGSFRGDAIVAPFSASLWVMASVGVFSAAIFRGGLIFQMLNVAVAGRGGGVASGPVALMRAIVAWSPCVLFLIAISYNSLVLGALAVVALVGGATVAGLRPSRGLQDRLVGTRLVPK